MGIELFVLEAMKVEDNFALREKLGKKKGGMVLRQLGAAEGAGDRRRERGMWCDSAWTLAVRTSRAESSAAREDASAATVGSWSSVM